MEDLTVLQQLIRPGDHMVKLDLKDAYLTAPMLEEHRRFLRFRWDDKQYDFMCLPFGISSAPRAFTKLLKPVVAWLRTQDIRVIVYLGDFIILSQNKKRLPGELNLAVQILKDLGFLINWEK